MFCSVRHGFWGQALLIFLIEFAQQIRNASLSGRRALQVSKGQSPLFAQGTDSYAFSQLLKPSKSGIPKKLTHFRLALDAVRSARGEFSPQSGGLWGKEGALCKRERPLERTSDMENSFFRTIFWVA